MISSASDYIAPEVFNFITFGVVGAALIIGILVPKSKSQKFLKYFFEKYFPNIFRFSAI